MWETGGHASISARSLAQHAGVPISGLYNHFASLDDVFLQAQGDALAAARVWCATQLEQLFDFDGQKSRTFVAGGLGPIMAALIDEWTHGQRRLAFAWREGFLLAQHDPRFLPLWQDWRRLWTDFWQVVCTGCGLGDYGEWTSFMFEGEAPLHMLAWRRVPDRACLEDICEGWATWLGGRLTTEGPWRHRARIEALASSPDLPIRDDMAHRIASAAADVVAHQGMAKLTHRAVAAEAQVSLGMVSSRFRTSVDLVRAAFEMTYRRVTTSHGATDEVSDQDIARMIPQLTGEHISIANRRVFEELMLAVARDRTFQPFAPHLRYLRGRTSGRALQMMAGTEVTISPLDAALFSNLLSGMQRAGIDLSPANRASSGRSHIARLLHRLGLPEPALTPTPPAATPD